MRVTVKQVLPEQDERPPLEPGMVVDFQGVPYLVIREHPRWPDGWEVVNLGTAKHLGILLSSEGTILGRATAIEITVEDA